MEKQIRSPFAQNLQMFIRKPLTIIVWFAALISALILMKYRAYQYEYSGIAREVHYNISSTAECRVGSVLVDLYQEVKSGQKLISLDCCEIDAEMKGVAIEIDRLKAELAAEEEKYNITNHSNQSSMLDDKRGFETDQEQRRLDILDLNVDIETDQIELDRVEKELNRYKKLCGENVLSQSELDNKQHEYDLIKKRIEENKLLLNETEKSKASSEQRIKNYNKNVKNSSSEERWLAPFREAVKKQEVELEKYKLMKEKYTLYAPADGKVSQILARSGQSVKQGEILIVIAESSTSEILIWKQPDDSSSRIAENTKVLVFRNGAGTMIEGTVTRVGPTYEQMPASLWKNKQIPEYGHPVLIAISDSSGVIPGESVHIRLKR